MKKPIIIIIGPESSGKSFLAENLSLTFSNPFRIKGRKLNAKSLESFPFHYLTAFNDVIIIEEPVHFNDIRHFLESSVIKVARKNKSNIYLRIPHLIITVQSGFLSHEFINNHLSQFTFIECDYSSDYKIFNFKKLTPNSPQA